MCFPYEVASITRSANLSSDCANLASSTVTQSVLTVADVSRIALTSSTLLALDGLMLLAIIRACRNVSLYPSACDGGRQHRQMHDTLAYRYSYSPATLSRFTMSAHNCFKLKPASRNSYQ
jgi:hypothetical protein